MFFCYVDSDCEAEPRWDMLTAQNRPNSIRRT